MMRILPWFCSRFLLLSVVLFSATLLTTPATQAAVTEPLSFHEQISEPPLYYLRQADLNIAPQRQDFLIKAVISHIHDHDYDDAKAVLELLFAEPLTQKQLAQSKLLDAKIALLEQQPQKALDILYTLPPYLPQEMMRGQHDLLATAYDDLGEFILSLEQRLALDTRLNDNAAISANHQAIWKTVQHIPNKQILGVHNATANPTLKAWLSLANMKAQYANDPIALERAMFQWRHEYPEHPGLAISGLTEMAKHQLSAVEEAKPHTTLREKISAMASSVAPGLIPIQQRKTPMIAVLLPKHGEFAHAAKAIEQGIMNAYYQDPEEQRPIVQFYDSSQNVRVVYHRALQQGADLIIGPLSKNNVIEVYRAKHIPVKTVVLNTLPYQLSKRWQDTFYQFSLSNEDEAYQVALRAFQDGRSNALIIRSDKNWGQKLEEAFSEHFEQFGGSVRERLALKPNTDPAPDIKKLLQFQENPTKVLVEATQPKLESTSEEESNPLLDDSFTAADMADDTGESQEMAVETVVKEKLIRHRTDVDMIFLAVNPSTAQRVIPLLKFYYANDIPVYTTSIINSAHVDEAHDFDGTIFCDMPWILSSRYQAGELRNTLQKLWPNSTTSQPRLFAFGMDAYRVAKELQKQDPQLYKGIQGYTGNLSLIGNNRVFRQLSWAKYHQGKFELLDEL